MVSLACLSHYVVSNYIFSPELAAMSKTAPATSKLSPLPFVIMKIVTSYASTLQALSATSTYSLDHAMLCTSYENTINLTCALYTSENLTN
jgi:hypothetical protein